MTYMSAKVSINVLAAYKSIRVSGAHLVSPPNCSAGYK